MENNEPKTFSTPKKPRFLLYLYFISSPLPGKNFSLSQISPFLHKHLLLSNLSTQLGNKVQQPQQRKNKENHNKIFSFPDRLLQRFKFNRVLRITLCRIGGLFLPSSTEERKKSAHKFEGGRIVRLPFLPQRQVT